MIKGNDLNFMFTVGGINYPFCHATDWSIQSDATLIETTTKGSPNGRTYEYDGRHGYILSVSGLSTLLDGSNFYTVVNNLKNFDKVQWIATDDADITYSGTILITATTLNAPLDQLSTFSAELQGDGDYSVVNEAPEPPPETFYVVIRDQLGNTIATVAAPGIYNVLRFDTIDEGDSTPQTRNLIIMEGE